MSVVRSCERRGAGTTLTVGAVHITSISAGDRGQAGGEFPCPRPVRPPGIRFSLSHPAVSSPAAFGAGLSRCGGDRRRRHGHARRSQTGCSAYPCRSSIHRRQHSGSETDAVRRYATRRCSRRTGRRGQTILHGGDTRSERDCGLVKPRKPRMVRVPTDRPAIAAVPLGRIAPPPASIIDEMIPAASAGQPGDLAKSGEAVAAAASSTEPHKGTATPKKAQRSAHRQTQRRDPYWYGAPSWREVRVDDWAARGYAPRERDYRRGGYGSPSFW